MLTQVWQVCFFYLFIYLLQGPSNMDMTVVVTRIHTKFSVLCYSFSEEKILHYKYFKDRNDCLYKKIIFSSKKANENILLFDRDDFQIL